jgi:polyvinyl alcohol dehydrogenase (cytochrome)
MGLTCAGLGSALLWMSLEASSTAQAQAPTPPPRASGTEFGFAVFQTHCTSCHGNPAYAGRAPDAATLRQMPPERIYQALVSGTMVVQGRELSDEQKRHVAEFMSGRPLGSAAAGDVSTMTGRCAHDPPLAEDSSSAWNGWSAEAGNSRYQPTPGLAARDVPRLALRWAFGFPHGVSSFAQPAVVAGRVFVGSDIGYLYSLDARSGCAYWSFQAQGSIRTAVTLAPLPGHEGSSVRRAVYFGDSHANVYALEAGSGALLWRTHVEEHFAARITGAPTLGKGVLYVPVSASEGFAAAAPSYPCCTFRGSVVALDAATGKQLWKSYVIPESPRPVRRNELGTQLWAPAGGSVWDAPTLDEKLGALYFGTGDAETQPASANSDAVMAVDIRRGRILWVYQTLANDAWIGGCSGPSPPTACPHPLGPDRDIGNSPILRTLAGGQRVLVAATKDARVFALDPDRGGAVLWQVRVSEPSAGNRSSGVLFGGAADERSVYYPLSGGEVAAVDLASGTTRWLRRLAPQGTGVALAAAATAIPGVVFIGGYDGELRALATRDGHILWQVDTNRDYHTVNGVAAHGGSMGSAGASVAGGMLFFGAGYGVTSGTPGNVLLAFAPAAPPRGSHSSARVAATRAPQLH